MERVEGVAAPVMAGGGARAPSLWRTPTPYLFLGFAVMMGLIVVALLVLVCTRRKPAAADDEKAATVRGVLVPLDREPKVVVIMAGDALPSFIAVASAKMPLAFATPSAGAEEAV